MCYYISCTNALIAQLDRASGYGPEGREFESSSARQEEFICKGRFFFFLLRRFEKNGLSFRTNCNLSVNGCKVRVRVGNLVAERIFFSAPIKMTTLLCGRFNFCTKDLNSRREFVEAVTKPRQAL